MTSVHFSKTINTHRIFEIECLRGFAALYVVLFHVLRPEIQAYSYVLSIPFRFGQEAVILFFLLSGFSINYSWSKREEKSFPIFAKDRLVRIMPIFLVSAMESIGDITATNNLSGLKTGTPDYWLRIRGGIMATAFSSFIAALFCTFPSTTFSQNNGVIRLTGVCSRHVGNYVAGFLVILGCLPVVTAVFQRIPSEVIFGATLLMFMLVALSGFRVVEMARPRARDWTVVVLAIVLGYVISMFIDRVPSLSPEIVILFQFPVSTGALVALVLEFVIPSGDADASD